MAHALDTNTIIHLLCNTPAVIAQRDTAIKQGIKLIIPPYVNFEILRGFHYVPATSKQRMYKEMCACYPVEEMTVRVWERAAVLYADLRRDGFTVGDADILIAAFCLVNDYALVTNNTKDFENIYGLQIVDWTKE